MSTAGNEAVLAEDEAGVESKREPTAAALAAATVFDACFTALPQDMRFWTGSNVGDFRNSQTRARERILEEHGRDGGEFEILIKLATCVNILSALYPKSSGDEGQVAIETTVQALNALAEDTYGKTIVDGELASQVMASAARRQRKLRKERRSEDRQANV